MFWLAILCLFLLLVATWLLSSGRYVWDGALFAILSLITLVVIHVRRLPSMKWHVGRVRTFVPHSLSAWARVAALFVSALVALAARAQDARDYTPIIAAWCIAVTAFTLSLVVELVRSRPLVSEQLRLRPRERWLLMGLLLAALAVRAIALDKIPANLGGDEGTQLVAGLDLLEPPVGNPFTTGWYSVPTMSFLAYGLTMRMMGATIAGGRALSVLVGTLTVLTTFLLGRSLIGRRVGWIAATVMAFSAYHIHYSRLASNQIADPLFATVTLWLLWMAVRSLSQQPVARKALWGLTGLVAGLGWYGYFGARWVTAIAGIVVLWRWLVEVEFLRRHWRGMVIGLVGFFVVTLPLLGWYAAHPTALTERYSAVSIFGSGWLANEIATTGKTPAALLLHQFWRAVSAFHVTPDPTFWYRPERPLLDFVTGALMLIGMIEALIHVRWPSRTFVLIWFWSTLMMAWGVTENPPSSQRGLLLMPAVALLVGWGAEFACEILRSNAPSVSTRHGIPTSVLLQAGTVAAMTAVVVLNLTFYFGVYTPRRIYGNPTAEAATSFGRYMLANPEPVCAFVNASSNKILRIDTYVCPGRVYFLGPPFLYWDFGALGFMLRGIPGEDVAPGEWPDAVSVPARFVLVPERLSELETLKARYPGGTLSELRNDTGRLLMSIYDWVP